MISRTIESFAQAERNVFLVQIGSNDGITVDPFYNYIIRNDWRCLLVEPVPYVFDRLRQTHKNSNKIILENAAVSTRSEVKPFYYLQHQPKGRLPYWYDQIGSFSREQVLKERASIPDIERYIVSRPVPCLSLRELLDKHAISQIDIFHTDLEGYDAVVLEQFDIEKYRPRLVLFEHKHLSRTERDNARNHLEKHGFKFVAGRDDTLAIRTRLR